MMEHIIVGVFSTNSYLFSQWEKKCIIIDPGGDIEKIISHILQIDMVPKGIVCTHGHIDHISGIRDIQNYYKSSEIVIPLAVHEYDLHFFGSEAGKIHTESINAVSDNLLLSMNIDINAIPEPDIILKEGDTLFNSDLTVIHTPGHTPGGISLYSKSQSFLFSGDTLFYEGVGRTDLPGGDTETLIKSIRSKLIQLPDDTKVFPGHGSFTTIRQERTHNPFITS